MKDLIMAELNTKMKKRYSINMFNSKRIFLVLFFIPFFIAGCMNPKYFMPDKGDVTKILEKKYCEKFIIINYTREPIYNYHQNQLIQGTLLGFIERIFHKPDNYEYDYEISPINNKDIVFLVRKNGLDEQKIIWDTYYEKMLEFEAKNIIFPLIEDLLHNDDNLECFVGAYDTLSPDYFYDLEKKWIHLKDIIYWESLQSEPLPNVIITYRLNIIRDETIFSGKELNLLYNLFTTINHDIMNKMTDIEIKIRKRHTDSISRIGWNSYYPENIDTQAKFDTFIKDTLERGY
jgi:hypothetical protein